MKTELKLRYQKALKQSFTKGFITERKYEKELKFIRKYEKSLLKNNI